MSTVQPSCRATERVERAATLMIAASGLAALALVGWGGLIVDLHWPAQLFGSLVGAVQQGTPLWPALTRALGTTQLADLWAIVGTVVTTVFVWHVVSLAAELALLLGSSLGWLLAGWLRPIWLLLDVLDSAPLATPKRFAVATALAAQVTVRTVAPLQAAAGPPTRDVVIVSGRPVMTVEQAGLATAPTNDGNSDSATAQDHADDDDQSQADAPWFARHIVEGDNLWDISRRYYGDGAYWHVLFQDNYGAVMEYPRLGLGHPVRLTNPNYVLQDWNLVVPPVPGRLEVGPNGEVVYVVQPGDTFDRIAERFDVSPDDFWATNDGATTPDGGTLGQPEDISPGQRLQVRPIGAPSQPPAEPESPAMVDSVAPLEEPSRAPPTAMPTADTVLPTPAATAQLVPTPAVLPTAPPAPTPISDTSAPTLDAQEARRLLPLVPLAAGAVAVAVGAAALRRRRQPETDLELADAGRVAAEPMRALRARAAGDALELLSAELLRAAGDAGVAYTDVVVAYRGRGNTTIVLAVPATQSGRLPLLLPARVSRLARRVTAWETRDRDVEVLLEDPLEGLPSPLPDSAVVPNLVSLGALGDGRELLVGWRALGNLLVVSMAESDAAQTQLAATVAMLAARRSVDQLRLYTWAGPSTALTALAPLPHQQVLAQSNEEMRDLLTALEQSLDEHDASGPDRVLVLGELGALATDERATLARLLTSGEAHGLRVLAATTDLELAASIELGNFTSRAVFALDDPDTSVRVLGVEDAALVPEGGMAVRVGGRVRVIEAAGTVLLPEDLAALLAAMRSATAGAPASDADTPARPEAKAASVTTGEHASSAGAQPRSTNEAGPVDETPKSNFPLLNGREELTPEVTSTPAPAILPDRADDADHTAVNDRSDPRLRNGSSGNGISHASAGEVIRTSEQPPTHLAALLDHVKPGMLVIGCMPRPALWYRDEAGGVRLVGPGAGRGDIAPTRRCELLIRVAVAAGDGELTSGISELDLRSSLWGGRASEKIVSTTVSRLEQDLQEAGVRLAGRIVLTRDSLVALNPVACVSDIQAFRTAVDQARHCAAGPVALAAAESAVAAYGGRLLSELGGLTRRAGHQPRGPLFGWVDELPTQRVIGALEAQYREALLLLAARLRDAGRWEEALRRHWQVLDVGEVLPADRTCETVALGVLEAAAALGDPARLHAEFELLAHRLDQIGEELTPFVVERHDSLMRKLSVAGPIGIAQ
jgi:hypothetical protein